MIIDNTNVWNSPVRNINARVELYEGSTLAVSYTDRGSLKSFSVERLGESKFFGYGICQKTNIKLIDVNREKEISTANSFKNFVGAGGILTTSFPTFYVSEVHRDENTNELSITAYDALYKAAERKVEELGLEAPYTIRDVAIACADLLGINGIEIVGVVEEINPFDTEYPEGANFEGSETVREALNAIAGATQTIYFIDKDEKLIFKRLDTSGSAALAITKADYITLDSKTNRRLSAICSATELGDNVIATLDTTGTTEYVRDNPFWELRDDIDILVENALAATGNLTINQFDCTWRGNPSLEIGDKIDLTTKDNDTVSSYLLNDTIEFNGGLTQHSKWEYTDSAESSDNPSTLGDALKKTYAKVDKANQEIEIVAGETSAIKLTADSVQQSVKEMDSEISNLTREVSSKMTSEEVSFIVQSAMDQGVERITTSTGYTFNEEGLHITKTDSEITTSITEDGMTVYRNDDEVLVADNLGVRAEDLHATTFLIVGNNSRFEDYEGNRTGCFWIGR